MRIPTQAVRRLAGRKPGWVHRRLREPPRDAPTMKIATTFRPQPSNQAFYLYIAE